MAMATRVELYEERKGWLQRCSMCNKRLRDGDVVLFMSRGDAKRKFHRLCLKRFIEASYGEVALQPIEQIEDDLGVVVADNETLFDAYREKLISQLEDAEV